jgi:hypothetical protein
MLALPDRLRFVLHAPLLSCYGGFPRWAPICEKQIGNRSVEANRTREDLSSDEQVDLIEWGELIDDLKDQRDRWFRIIKQLLKRYEGYDKSDGVQAISDMKALADECANRFGSAIVEISLLDREPFGLLFKEIETGVLCERVILYDIHYRVPDLVDESHHWLAMISNIV